MTGVATFAVEVEEYDPRQLRDCTGGPGWAMEPGRAALLVHDLLPYYLNVLPPSVAEWVIAQAIALVAWGEQNGVPLIATAPRAARDLAQRGLGGHLWGLGPSRDQASVSAVPTLMDLNRDVTWVQKRSLSAFFATDLHVEMSRRGRDQLLVVGVFAAAGITATTFDALAHDIMPFVVSDASADYSLTRHTAALRHIASTTGQVVATEAILATELH